jgi:hypothetical protein
LFENEAIVAVLPQIGTEENSWVFLAKLKPGDLSARQSALGKIELGLKNDFFLNETSYRQLKIRSVHSLTNPESQYFYCQANDYIAISNGQAALVSILDRIIGR